MLLIAESMKITDSPGTSPHCWKPVTQNWAGTAAWKVEALQLKPENTLGCFFLPQPGTPVTHEEPLLGSRSLSPFTVLGDHSVRAGEREGLKQVQELSKIWNEPSCLNYCADLFQDYRMCW